MKRASLECAPLRREGLDSAREDERRRLARELHDGPAQALAAALFGVDLALAAVGREPARAREELLSARALVRDALDDVRALMTGLRPRLLEERGLAAAVRAIAAMPALWGPEVQVETRGLASGERLAPDVELGIFRIAQEAVSNARRHSAASRIQVTLDVANDWVRLEVADDGRGLADFPGQGNGLPGMRERVALLGGDLKILSSPGTGTRVEVWLPLRERGTRHGEGQDEPDRDSRRR